MSETVFSLEFDPSIPKERVAEFLQILEEKIKEENGTLKFHFDQTPFNQTLQNLIDEATKKSQPNPNALKDSVHDAIITYWEDRKGTIEEILQLWKIRKQKETEEIELLRE